MRQVWIVYKKEMKEMWHNRKWIWIPIVFLLLGVMQPVMTHLMPQILKMSGGLPKGSVVHIPTPAAADVIGKVQSQFGTIGLLVLALAFMGTTATERQRGVLELVLVKPVAYGSYIVAKWLAMLSTVVVAVGLGYLGAWYYTEQLIGTISLSHVLAGAVVYMLWIVVFLTLTVLFSTLLNSTVATAFLTLIVAAAVSYASSLMKWEWSPGYLPNQALKLISGQSASKLIGSVPFSLIVMAGVLVWTSVLLSNRVVSARES